MVKLPSLDMKLNIKDSIIQMLTPENQIMVQRMVLMRKKKSDIISLDRNFSQNLNKELIHYIFKMNPYIIQFNY